MNFSRSCTQHMRPSTLAQCFAPPPPPKQTPCRRPCTRTCIYFLYKIILCKAKFYSYQLELPASLLVPFSAHYTATDLTFTSLVKQLQRERKKNAQEPLKLALGAGGAAAPGGGGGGGGGVFVNRVYMYTWAHAFIGCKMCSGRSLGTDEDRRKLQLLTSTVAVTHFKLSLDNLEFWHYTF